MVARDRKLHHRRALNVRRGHTFVVHDEFGFEQVEVKALALTKIARVKSAISFGVGSVGAISVEVGGVCGDFSGILKQPSPVPLPGERG